MSVILTIYHVLGILVGFTIVLGGLLKVYTTAIKNELRNQWQKEITSVRETIDTNNEQRIVEIHRKIDRECSTENIKSKVKDFIDGELKVMQQDISQIKDITVDLKRLLGTQQETLIAIQLSITELKPRIANLEDRVERLEKKSD